MKKSQNFSIEEVEKIIAERDFYKRVLNSILALIHINNLQKETVEWINDFVEKESGYKKEEILNNPGFFDGKIFNEEDGWLKESIDDYKVQEGVYSAIFSFINKDLSKATYLSTGVVFDIDDNGNPIRNLCIDYNITNEMCFYRNLKAHLAELTARLNKSILRNFSQLQIEIILLLCEGKTNKDIALQLNRSHHAIDNHKRKIYQKLNINKTSALAAWAKDVGLI